MNTIITGDESSVYGYDTETKSVPSFSLQLKSDESTKHYLIQMLLVINWRYWQARKHSRMLTKVQRRLMKARFIEIH